MQAVISQHGGYISDYIGDAIVAVFTEGRHGTGTMNSAYMAVRAAVEMQKSLAGLREHSLNPNLQSLRMGIGINTGFLVEGDMGPRARLKYAVLGDTVNTAARIQDRSKEGRHTCILVSGQTYESVREDFDAVFFGNELLKGKSEPVAIWEITGSREAVAALDGSQAAPG
jgi:adenylate cyclase